MVESLKELNRICQKPRYREVGNWVARYLVRDAALPITWLLLHTPVSANQVTLFSLLIGFLGVFFFSLPAKGCFLGGAILFQFWYLLDHVDGQIARYRGQATLTGRFFDFMTHHLIHGVIFFGLGFYVYLKTGQVFFLVFGFLSSLAMMVFNLVHDTKYKTFFEKLLTVKSIRIAAPSDLPQERREKGNRSFLRKTFSFLHKLSEVHVLMNILTGAVILEVFLKVPWDTRFWLLLFYGIVIPILATLKLSYVILTRKIDQEFKQIFREV